MAAKEVLLQRTVLRVGMKVVWDRVQGPFKGAIHKHEETGQLLIKGFQSDLKGRDDVTPDSWIIADFMKLYISAPGPCPHCAPFEGLVRMDKARLSQADNVIPAGGWCSCMVCFGGYL